MFGWIYSAFLRSVPAAKRHEVRLQSNIFLRSVGGVAWLHKTLQVWPLTYRMIDWYHLISIAISAAHNSSESTPTYRKVPMPYGSLTALFKLVSDPWFTSRWTSQEACLAPDLRLVGIDEQPFVGFINGAVDQPEFWCQPLVLSKLGEAIHMLRTFSNVWLRLYQRCTSVDPRPRSDQCRTEILGSRYGSDPL